MDNIVFEKLWTLCIKYRSVLAFEEVYQLDTLLWVVWNNMNRSSYAAEVDAENGFLCVHEDLLADSGKVDVLLEELRIIYSRLEEMGITKEMARQMLWERERISRLYVYRDGRIVLPDYCVEITLPPLQWVLYVLFLRYDGGINFKSLYDYKDEIMDMLISRHKNSDGQVNMLRLLKIVERLTDSNGGAINEIVSKIRRTFIDAIGSEDCARHYCISGTRGGTRRISIDRKFVEIYD